MEFVSENTAIPVPKGYCSFVRKNRAYIVMERIQGEEVPSAWRKLNESSRKGIYDQLQRMIKELRSLEPPKAQGVSSCVGGSLRDSRIPRSRPRSGPFESVNEFHLWLRDYLQPFEHSTWEMAAKQDGPWPPPVFTHGDLDPFNVLIRDGKVVGIIDWEFSGWYPHYWEYTTAWLGNATRTGWRDQLCESLDQFPAELVMDKVRHRWWGDF
ncbi:kinase-like domain-containing protein [Aspergillus aurantiobrunneus]